MADSKERVVLGTALPPPPPPVWCLVCSDGGVQARELSRTLDKGGALEVARW